MPWLQQGGTDEPEMNISFPQQQEQAYAKRGEAIADYDLDVDYKPDESDPEIKAFDEEEKNSDADYVKMEQLNPGHCARDDRLQGYRKDPLGTLHTRT